MFPYIFTEAALADVVKQAMYYEDKEIGLEQRFMNAVEIAAAEISRNPKGFVNLYKTSRERRTKNFPYTLIYTFENSIIYIHAVFPCKSNPSKKYRKIKKQ